MRLWVGLCAAGILVTTALPGAVSAYEQRSGTLSIGLQGQVSGLLSAKPCLNCLPTATSNDPDGLIDVDYGLFGLDGTDGAGVGLTVRFRYAIDRKSALGVSFDAMDFDRAVPRSELAAFEISSRDTAEKIHATVVTADYYRYFWRKAQDTPYVTVGAGFYRPEIRFDELSTSFPGSNLALTFGGGGEHFFTRSVSLDFSVRFHSLFHEGGPSLSSQLALGIRFYHLVGRRRR